jgi:hypothetical protein
MRPHELATQGPKTPFTTPEPASRSMNARINHRRMMLVKKYKIAVLDDYQNVALKSADWSVLGDQADITVFPSFMGRRNIPCLKVRTRPCRARST